MHAVDSLGSVSGQWFDGDPGHVPPLPPTKFTQDWFNDMQGNLLALLTMAAIAPVKLDLTQIAGSVANLAFAGGGKGCANLLDNSDFWLFQRFGPGVTTTTTAKYVPDRWKCFGGGGSGSADISQVGIDLSEIPEGRALLDALSAGHVPGAGATAMKWSQAVAATSTNPSFEQRQTELLWLTAGKTVTISFWAKLDAATARSISVELEQNFGTGGSPSSPVVVAAGTVSVASTSWTRFTVTASLASISGKTRGTSPGYLALRFKIPLSVSFNIYFSWIDMKIAGGATPYVHPGLKADWLECSRYYWKTTERDIAPSTATQIGELSSQETGTNLAGINTRFPIEMRDVPTITWHAPSDGSSGKVDRAGSATSVTGTVGTSRKTTGYPQTGSAGDTLNEANAEADCEL